MTRSSNGRWDLEQIQLLVLECIHDQSTSGALRQDLLNRCELNHHYANQAINNLLDMEAIEAITPANVDTLGKYERRPHYFLTAKGKELRIGMKKEFKQLGIDTTINNPRVKVR